MMSQKARGFTLVEMLVVIAIIAVLAGLLVPLYSRARDKARQTTCISNQRQIAIAISSYAQDHNEVLPLADTVWHEVRMGPGITRCPTLGPNANGYLYNIALSGASLGAITQPTRTFVTIDGNYDSQVEVSTSTPPVANTITEEAVRNVYYMPGDVDFRHLEKCAVSYLDNHAELTTHTPQLDVEWMNPTNATATYNSYTATAPHTGSAVRVTDLVACTAWNTRARGDLGLGSHGQVTFRFASNTTHAVLGIGAQSCAAVTALNYGIYGKQGQLRFTEGDNMGIVPDSPADAAYIPSDSFTIQRTGDNIAFMKGGRLIRSVMLPGDPGILFVHAWFTSDPGDTVQPGITHASYSGTVK